DRDGRLEGAQVVGVEGLAEVEHDVVGDVDREGDGAHSCLDQAPFHPVGGGRIRVDSPHDAGDEPVTTHVAPDRGIVVDDDGEARLVRGRHRPNRRVAERRPGGVGVLAGDAAHGEAVAAVGGDVDLQHRLAQAEEFQRVGARGRGGAGQHDDARMVLPEAEFAFRTDHAVGDVTVGLAGGDRKVPGKDRPGQGDDDAVPDAEVVGAAHDAAVTRLVVVVPDVDVAPVDRLA